MIKDPTNTTRFVSVQKIYDRITFYKDKQEDKYLLDEYHVAILDNDAKITISFVSPRGISLVQPDEYGQMYTTVLEYDEAIGILRLHLRAKKINKIKNEKRYRTS